MEGWRFWQGAKFFKKVCLGFKLDEVQSDTEKPVDNVDKTFIPLVTDAQDK